MEDGRAVNAFTRGSAQAVTSLAPAIGGESRLQRKLKLVGPTQTDEDFALERAIAVDGDLDLVAARGQPEALEDAIEVVHHPGVGSVHEDFRLPPELVLLEFEPDPPAVAARAIVAVAGSVAEPMGAMETVVAMGAMQAMPDAVAEVACMGLGRK